jgi:anti-sigma factor RsiW
MKDSCSRPIKLLEKYLDGEATDHERDLVANHLRECQACQAELNSMKGLHTLIATPVEEAARQEDFPWIWQKIERRIQTQEKSSRLQSLRQWLSLSPFLRRRVWVPALAVALLVVAVVPFLMKVTPSPSAASVVVYVESQTNNVMVYERETDQGAEAAVVIWVFEEPEEEPLPT